MQKISIVTVCYNAAATIGETIESVLGQTYPNVEYIIIDGGSTDGSVDIIKQYADRLAYWVSEPDNGIYDAMNKGIAVATGEFINFMNAGDKYYDDKVIQDVFSRPYSDHSAVIYGKTLMHYPWGKYIVSPRNFPNCHQSTFIRLSIHKDRPFDLSYKISADFHFFLSIYKSSPQSFVLYHNVIAIYDHTNGISSQYSDTHLSEVERVMGKRQMNFRIKRMIKKFIPHNLYNIIYRIFFYFNSQYKRVR